LIVICNWGIATSLYKSISDILNSIENNWLQVWTTDMTGLTNPPKRASLWKSKRVFFVTPQVLEKDIQSGD